MQDAVRAVRRRTGRGWSAYCERRKLTSRQNAFLKEKAPVNKTALVHLDGNGSRSSPHLLVTTPVDCNPPSAGGAGSCDRATMLPTDCGSRNCSLNGLPVLQYCNCWFVSRRYSPSPILAIRAVALQYCCYPLRIPAGCVQYELLASQRTSRYLSAL